MNPMPQAPWWMVTTLLGGCWSVPAPQGQVPARGADPGGPTVAANPAPVPTTPGAIPTCTDRLEVQDVPIDLGGPVRESHEQPLQVFVRQHSHLEGETL